jgi:hypothetical protein
LQSLSFCLYVCVCVNVEICNKSHLILTHSTPDPRAPSPFLAPHYNITRILQERKQTSQISTSTIREETTYETTPSTRAHLSPPLAAQRSFPLVAASRLTLAMQCNPPTPKPTPTTCRRLPACRPHTHTPSSPSQPSPCLCTPPAQPFQTRHPGRSNN